MTQRPGGSEAHHSHDEQAPEDIGAHPCTELGGPFLERVSEVTEGGFERQFGTFDGSPYYRAGPVLCRGGAGAGQGGSKSLRSDETNGTIRW